MKSLPEIKADNRKAAKPIPGVDDRVRARFAAAAKALHAVDLAAQAVTAALEEADQVEDGVLFDGRRADLLILAARCATELTARSLEAAQLVRVRRHGNRDERIGGKR